MERAGDEFSSRSSDGPDIFIVLRSLKGEKGYGFERKIMKTIMEIDVYEAHTPTLNNAYKILPNLNQIQTPS
jgi:hypothetical protein